MHEVASSNSVGCCRQAGLQLTVWLPLQPWARVSATQTTSILHLVSDQPARLKLLHALNAGTGNLTYTWSNICMHYFSLAFLQYIATQLQSSLAYHVAQKSIPSKDGSVKVLK